MERDFPAHVYVNPTNTKSKGPFVIRLVKPKYIFKVIITGNAYHLIPLACLEGDGNPYAEVDGVEPESMPQTRATWRATNWLKAQIAEGQVMLPVN